MAQRLKDLFMTEQDDQRVDRDFFQRSLEDQQDFITNTWCDHCSKENLGLTKPVEYEQAGTIFIEGLCAQCQNTVVTELTEDDF
jgi:hypothetical protein